MFASLRFRVGLVVALFVAVEATGVGLIAHRRFSDLIYQAALLRGRAVLEALSVPASIAIATQNFPRLDSFVSELASKEHEELLLLAVLDPDGHVLGSSRTGFLGSRQTLFGEGFTAQAIASDTLWFAFGPTRTSPTYLDVSLPLAPGQRQGTLCGRFSLDALGAQRRSLAHGVGMFAVLGGLVFWLLAMGLLNLLVLRPTGRLAAMARRIGEGDLAARSDLRRRDELGALGRSLDHMAERLQDATGQLEQRVQERTVELEQANQELERLATTDALTDLRNVRYFHDTLDHEFRRGVRHPLPLALCMLDLDHFKHYNDRHGHPAGDELLQAFARVLRENTRGSDVVARYGGEEFVVLMIGCGAENGQRVAEKLVAQVRQHPFPRGDQQPLGRLTVSAGLAAWPDDAGSAAELIDCADRAMYQAKRAGRDQAVRYHADLGHPGPAGSELP